MEMGDQQQEFYWDDAKGGWLDAALVMEARKLEMQYFRKMNVYDKVDRSQMELEGKQAIPRALGGYQQRHSCAP